MEYKLAVPTIECPECGTKNTILEQLQPDKSYRCGKCHAEITLLEVVEPSKRGEEIQKQTQNQPLLSVDTQKRIFTGKAVFGVTGGEDLPYHANIECLECGGKNRFPRPLRSEHKYMCGDCGATIQSAMTSHPTSKSAEVQQATSTTNLLPNTSGQGKLATVPSEVEGWNWGAFLLPLWWSIGNNVWIGLLIFVPFFNIIWLFVMGAKGNEWAWQNKRWDSIEHFKKTQITWGVWGAFITVSLLLIWFFVGLGMESYP